MIWLTALTLIGLPLMVAWYWSMNTRTTTALAMVFAMYWFGTLAITIADSFQ